MYVPSPPASLAPPRLRPCDAGPDLRSLPEQFSIPFGLKNRLWFDVYRLPRNRDVCPHLNSLTASALRSKRAVLALHASQRDAGNPARAVPPPPPPNAHGLPTGPTIVRPRCRDCRPASADLWLCLTAECNHIGCGRRQPKQHAKAHAEATGHPLSARTTTTELWCYECHKWIGGENEPELERARNLEIVAELAPTALDMQLLRRRQQDRAAWSRLRAGDAFYLVALPWFDHWTRFIMGDEPPPPPSLLRSQHDLHEAVMQDDPVMFNIDYVVVNENNWRYLQNTYGIAPELAEAHVENDIVLSTLDLVRNNLDLA